MGDLSEDLAFATRKWTAEQGLLSRGILPDTRGMKKGDLEGLR